MELTIKQIISKENIEARRKAELIYYNLFGAPKTHKEVAESFNIIHDIK